MRDILPDQIDRDCLMRGKLKACPFCGGTPVTINRVNEETKVFRSLVSCSRCMGQVGYNAETKDKARQNAIARWEFRAVGQNT